MLRRSPLAAVLGAALLAAPAAAQLPPPPTALPAITIRDQTDGVNSLRVVTVAAFCRGPAPCAGTAKLTKGGKTIGRAPFPAAGKTTFKTPMKLAPATFRALRKAPAKKAKPTLTLTLANGQAFSPGITIQVEIIEARRARPACGRRYARPTRRARGRSSGRSRSPA